MNNPARTLVGAAVGSVLTLAVVLGQPALAGQVEKAAAKNSVTSKSIKNGTIQAKDLNAAVNASLAKANSALQKVPADSVTGTEVKNGSLTAGDIAVATGSLTFDFPNIAAAGQCQDSTAVNAGKPLDNAIILVESPFGVVGAVRMQAHPVAAGSAQFVIQACNTGGAFDPPSETYTWAVIGG